MTSFIPIFAILMMVMMNHSTDSGAVSKSNPRQNVEMRKSRSFAKSKTKRSKKYTFLAKNYQKSAERDKMPARNNEKKSAKNYQKSTKKGKGQTFAKEGPKRSAKNYQKSPKKRRKKQQESTMKSQQQMEFGDFEHCDYIDLREVGYRRCSDFYCKPGGKFLFQVLFC